MGRKDIMNQKELKKRYADILTHEVWKNSAHMVDYCVKKAGYIVELTNGDIVIIDKPSIQKDFCFGYSDSRYDTEDYDRANAMARHAQTSEDYFLSENLRDIERQINLLTGKEKSGFDFYLRIPYYGQPDDSQLKGITTYYWYDEESAKYPKLCGEDRQRVIDGYKEVKTAFEKRLHAYLKRYGLSKVNSWSYWQDE